jgi:hypothetical protein
MATTSGGYIIQKPLVFRKRTQEERNSDDGVRPKPPAAKRTTTNVSFTNKNRNSKRKANNNNPNPRWKY